MKAPLMFEFSGLKVLVVGAGKTGVRRSNLLSSYGAQVTLIDPNINADQLTDLSKKVVFLNKEYKKKLITDFNMVVACTNNKELNNEIVLEARHQRKLSASSEFNQLANLSFPAVFHENDLWAAYSTSGKIPGLASELKNCFANGWERENSQKFRLLSRARETIRVITPEKTLREKRLENLSELSEEELKSLQEKPKLIRIGTRGSKLALAQTQSVIESLREYFPGLIFETVVIKTKGDRDQTHPLNELGENVFVTEIEKALLDKKIDFAVHSLKDLPSKIDKRLALATPPKREDVGEVLLRTTSKIQRIGTGSLRRKVFIRSLFPNAEILPLRGNIETRIKKLIQGDYDAIITASAALKRLNLSKDVLKKQGVILEELDILPALRQGLLGLEYRKNDLRTAYLLEPIGDPQSGFEMVFENTFLSELGGDCSMIIGGRFIGEDFKAVYIKDEKTISIISEVKTQLEGAKERAAELAKQIMGKRWSI